LRLPLFSHEQVIHLRIAARTFARSIEVLAMATRPISYFLASSLTALMLYATPLAAAEPFVDKALIEEGKRYELQLKAKVQVGRTPARDVRLAAEKAMAGAAADPRAASALFERAASLDAADGDAWLGLANALLAMKTDTLVNDERSMVPRNATAAAYKAYELAKTPAQKANALFIVGEAHKRTAKWRSAINAYLASLQLAETPRVRAAYTLAREEHGFRVTDTRIDADAASPRACVIFSERLAVKDVDWSAFVKVDGRTPQAVTAEGSQLCVDGLVHGRGYKFELRAGAPSAIGETLLKSVYLENYVRDRGASVRGVGKAYVLPASGQQGIPLTTTNVDLLGVEVYRIGDRGLAATLQNGEFARSIDSSEVEGIRERTGQKVYAGELGISSKLNEEVTTAFPVSEALPKLQPGLYLLSAKVLPKKAEGRDARGQASQWFIVSDLGLTTYSGDDGLHTFVRSLTRATSVGEANVRLVARNNEILATGKTDARGYVRFDAGLVKGEGGFAPQMLAVETAAGDYAFLDMSSTAFDLADRGVKGRDAPGPIDGFAYVDRGVYRPGETVHLAALVRDRAAKAANVPVILIVSRPDGVEYKRVTLSDQGQGGRVYPLVLGDNSMGGTWRAKVYTDPKAAPITQVSFLVEDFVPERMDLTLEAATPAISVETGGNVKLTGKYLYGPPAAGLSVEGDVVVKPAKGGLAAFPGYHFGRADEKIANAREALEGLPETDETGAAVVPIKLPKIDRTARPLTADVILRLKESGGRTIERTVTMPVDFKLPRIGVKPSFADEQAREGEMAEFDIVMLDSTGSAAAAKGLKWDLVRLEQRWQWYSRGGDWNYEAQTSTRRVGSGTVDVVAGQPGRIAQKLDWGRYRLEVSSSDGAAVTSILFNAGWHSDEMADSPEMLDIALDKPTYKAGEMARVKVSSKFAGKALVAVMGGNLRTFKEVDLPVGGGEIPVPVEVSWGAGAYVTVTLFRPLDGPAKRMPGRALGLRWIAVDQDARALKVSIVSPEKIKSASAVTVPIKLEGLAAGEEARVTLAAVDVGILNLTRFEAPKPEKWFYGQRKLGVEFRDFYARLIDGMRAEKGRLRSGGDGADAGGMSTQGSPPVEATLALFSGIVKVGADGVAQVPLQMPDFNGTVRLTAVAWSEDRLGSVSKDMIVRDPVALTVSAPRFLTLGDTARLQLDVHNVEGPAASYKVVVTANGEGKSIGSNELNLKAGEKKSFALDLKPDGIGPMPLLARVTGPNGITVVRPLDFDVKPAGGDIKRVVVSEMAAKGGKLTLSQDLFTDLIPSTAKATVHIGPLASLDVAGILNQLDRYPHGCAEQTTSRALPLLYVNDIAKQIGMGQDRELKERVQKAVERVFEMQDASGAFGIWGPSDGDMWLSSYVTDFLLRAKEANVTVDARGLKQALDRLQNFVSYAQDFQSGGESRAYALYVLARAGRAPVGELRYYIDARMGRFSSPLALAHLGAAASLTGDKPRAELAFGAAIKALDAAESVVLRQDYGSNLRDRAAVFTLASETKVVPATPQLVNVLAKAYQSKPYTSTQEQAWLLLAARSVSEQANAATLSVNGQPHQGKLIRSLTAAELKNGTLSISNDADAATTAVISVIGSALTPEPAMAKGFKLTRDYYSLDGKKIDLKSAAGGTSSLKQNDRMVVVLNVEADVKGGRILLMDRLPAGLEIENPRLVDSGDVKTLDWLKTSVKPDHTDFKDDRFIAAFNFFGTEGRSRRGSDDGDGDATENRGPVSSATVAYLVRAVTPGSFVHPAATVEDMYRPDRLARTATGRLTVTGK
jgi:uncharacterized protein YfaS (alpha-2-macroglobulin family)